MKSPSIGHNSGHLAPFDEEAAMDHIKDDMALVLLTVREWRKNEVTEKTEPILRTAIDQARKAFKKIDDARKEAKKPFQDEASRVDQFFRGPRKEMEDAGKELKAKGNEYLDKKADEERIRLAKEVAAKRAEAEKREAEALKTQAKIDSENRRMRADEAYDLIEKRREADKAQAQADKLEKEADTRQVASLSGGDGVRALGQRTRRVCAIADYEAAFFHYCLDEQIRELLVRLANRDANSKGFDDRKGIPGFKITTTRNL